MEVELGKVASLIRSRRGTAYQRINAGAHATSGAHAYMQDPGLLPYMSDRAPDINDPAGGATHDRNADILGKNRRNDLSVYGHFGPRRRGPIAKKDIIYPSELARRHVSGAWLFEVQPAT